MSIGGGNAGFRVFVAVGSSTFAFEAVLFVVGGDICNATACPVKRRSATAFAAIVRHISWHLLFARIYGLTAALFQPGPHLGSGESHNFSSKFGRGGGRQQ